MTTDQMATRRWGLRGTVAAIGVAAVIAALGGAAIYAATGGSQSITRPHQAFGPDTPPPIGSHSPGAQPAGETSLHGEFVVRDGMGGYTTALSQTGTVTASSPTSITVRSDDGYSQTYVIAQPAGPPPAIDEPVSVRATRDGQTSTVTAINAGN
jgi:hypothetical protein